MLAAGVRGSLLRRPAEGQGTMILGAPLKHASSSPHAHKVLLPLVIVVGLVTDIEPGSWLSVGTGSGSTEETMQVSSISRLIADDRVSPRLEFRHEFGEPIRVYR